MDTGCPVQPDRRHLSHAARSEQLGQLDGGAVDVRLLHRHRRDCGDRIPGIPRHILKFALSTELDPAWTLGAQASGQSGVFARGDENNRDVNGPVPGFFVFSLEGRYRPAPRWEVALRVDNLFDRTYSNYGQLSRNAFSGAGPKLQQQPRDLAGRAVPSWRRRVESG